MAKSTEICVLSWFSCKPKRPVRSIGGEEIIAAWEAVDKEEMISHVFSKMFTFKIPLVVVMVFKDSYRAS